MKMEDEYEYDDITGKRKKKTSVLNKEKISKYEMDDLFLGEQMVL